MKRLPSPVQHRCGPGRWQVGSCARCAAPPLYPRVAGDLSVLGSPVVWAGAVGLLGLILFPRVRTALSSSRAHASVLSPPAAPVPSPLEDLL